MSSLHPLFFIFCVIFFSLPLIIFFHKKKKKQDNILSYYSTNFLTYNKNRLFLSLSGGNYIDIDTKLLSNFIVKFLHQELFARVIINMVLC